MKKMFAALLFSMMIFAMAAGAEDGLTPGKQKSSLVTTVVAVYQQLVHLF